MRPSKWHVADDPGTVLVFQHEDTPSGFLRVPPDFHNARRGAKKVPATENPATFSSSRHLISSAKIAHALGAIGDFEP